jgi:2-phospho-L-lactate transferase/gluconeogenesis factor (CofD/UPF0052 family)
MTQPGETDGFNARDHLDAIERIAGAGLLDYYVSNNRPIPPAARRRYARDGARLVSLAPAAIRAHGVQPISRDLLQVESDRAKIRHHEGKLARALLRIARLHFSRAGEGRSTGISSRTGAATR